MRVRAANPGACAPKVFAPQVFAHTVFAPRVHAPGRELRDLSGASNPDSG